MPVVEHPGTAEGESKYDTSEFYLGPSVMSQDREHTDLHRDRKMPSMSTGTSAAVLGECLDTSVPNVACSVPRTSLSASRRYNSGDVLPPTDSARLLGKMPFEDGFLAFGTIRLVRDTSLVGATAENSLLIRGKHQDIAYPDVMITSAIKKGWIRVEDFSDTNAIGEPRLRVYIMPEDVDRGNLRNVRDFQKTVMWLLDFVDYSVDAWLGSASSHTKLVTYGSSMEVLEESLFYIFNTLQSPMPNLDSMDPAGYGYQAVNDALENEILGLKTTLYPYQSRSVAAMIQKEAEPTKICDARKRKFHDVYGRPFYLDPLEGVLLRDPPLYTEPQGGILAETMGYGKTLICIALILSTRGHYPKTPPNQIDSFRYDPRPRVGSLLTMAARRTKHEGLPWKGEFTALKAQGFHFDAILKELGKYERAYAEPIFTPTTPGRKGKRDSYNVVTLCSATLVIVPPNLLVQWQQEIEKHVDQHFLDVLTIDLPSKPVPSWKELLKYDVVIMPKSRFEQEYRDDDLNQGKSRRGDLRYRSPLTEIRWLRVICDEGHGFAGSSCRTNAMAMLDKMYIERRWVVSGTPSSTLHGVEVNLTNLVSSYTHDLEIDDSSNNSSKDFSRRMSINKALVKRRAPTAYEQEAKDLERLRLIVVNFLHLQPWANQRGHDNANWKKYLSPTATVDGQHHTSPLLRSLLQTLIVRHRIEDIDKDLQLPALHSKVVYLEPSYHDKLSINMFNLVLASNFVTSEREDEDYMFHPKNRRKFDLLINNLRQATFHWVGFTEDHVKETIKVSNQYLDENIDKISDQDGCLLTEALLNGERALNDPAWLALSRLHEIGVYLEGFPEHARGAWSLDGRDRDPTLFGTVQAREARKFVKGKASAMADDVSSGLAGAGVKAMRAAHDRAAEDAKQSMKAKSSDPENQSIGAAEEPKLRSTSMFLISSRKSTLENKGSVPSKTLKKRKWESTLKSLTASSPVSHDSAYSKVLQTSISGFTSAKLSYLMSQLLMHSPHSKSIVFYSHPNTAFFIAEALELLSIKHRIYASTLSMAQRNAYLQLFNADESIRVLLMDLKQAGQGLHIACANRVYIVAPIWEDGVQSQAIKRAHRIGQKSDVYVETLVLKGTFEEDLIRRRQEIDQDPTKAAELETEEESCTSLSIQPGGGSPIMSETLPRITSDVLPSGNMKTSHVAEGVLPASTATNAQPRVTQKQKSSSLLDDRHMVQVLKNIKFLKFTAEEDDPNNVESRIARIDVAHGRRMVFGERRHIEDDGNNITNYATINNQDPVRMASVTSVLSNNKRAITAMLKSTKPSSSKTIGSGHDDVRFSEASGMIIEESYPYVAKRVKMETP